MAKDKSICSADGCLSVIGPKGARGFCPRHYKWFRINGDPLDTTRHACSFDECPRIATVSGLCQKHVTQRATTGKLAHIPWRSKGEQPRPRPVCKYAWCDKSYYLQGLCSRHYAEANRPLGYYPQPKKRRPGSPSSEVLICRINTCGRPAKTRGLCPRHATQRHAFKIGVEEFCSWINGAKGCEICGRDRPLVVDHDHSCCPHRKRKCGECNRGLLCRQCNTAIGMIGDDPDIAAKALRYLLATRK